MFSEVENSSRHIDDLPVELIISIFKWLPLNSLLVCENVCQKWKELAHDLTLWRKINITYSGKQGQQQASKRLLKIITSHCDCIQCLKVQYVYNYQEIKSVLGGCKNLISLELIMCRLPKEFETDVKQWPNVRKINLRNTILFNNVEDITIPFNTFKYLYYLQLPEFGLNATNCDDLLHCKYLSHIYIDKIKCLSLEFVRQLIMTRQNILEAFHIYGGNTIDDHGMLLLSKCPLLSDLAITKCDTLTDKALFAITDMHRLQHLQIWNNKNFTEASLLVSLGQSTMVKLESLSLSRIENVTPPIVDVIAEFYKNLKFVAVYQCPRIINTDYEKQLKMKFRNIEVVLY